MNCYGTMEFYTHEQKCEIIYLDLLLLFVFSWSLLFADRCCCVALLFCCFFRRLVCVTGCSLFVVACWLLVGCRQSLVIGFWIGNIWWHFVMRANES